MSMPTLDEKTLDDLYKWLSAVPLSKPIKNIAKDFSDGVLIAELVAHFLPRYVILSNFTQVNSAALKRYNWDTLNKLVFAHLDYHINTSLIQKVIAGQPGAIEFVLFGLKEKINEAVKAGQFRPRKHRSRSASGRAGSQMSLNGANSEADLVQATSPGRMTGSVHRGESARVGGPCNGTSTSTTGGQPHQHHNNNINNSHHRFVGDAPPTASTQKQHHQAKEDLLAKEEQIQTLYARVRHLEGLVRLKDERITELTKQLKKVTHFNGEHEGTTTNRSTTIKPQPPPRSETSISSDGLSSTAITTPSPIRDRSDFDLDLK